MIEELKEVPYYESCSKICEEIQMDLHVCYWDDVAYKVTTSYWRTEYLGKASADDLHAKYNECISLLGKRKFL